MLHEKTRTIRSDDGIAESVNTPYELPPGPIDGNYRHYLKLLAEKIRHPPEDTRKKEIGYLVTKDISTESWGDFADVKRGYTCYYERNATIITSMAYAMVS